MKKKILMQISIYVIIVLILASFSSVVGYRTIESSKNIEEDKELNRIVEKIETLDCDCDNDKTSYWDFPILCRILYIICSIGYWWGFWGGVSLLGWLASIFPGELIEYLILYPRALMAILVFSISLTLATLFDCYWLDE